MTSKLTAPPIQNLYLERVFIFVPGFLPSRLWFSADAALSAFSVVTQVLRRGLVPRLSLDHPQKCSLAAQLRFQSASLVAVQLEANRPDRCHPHGHVPHRIDLTRLGVQSLLLIEVSHVCRPWLLSPSRSNCFPPLSEPCCCSSSPTLAPESSTPVSTASAMPVKRRGASARASDRFFVVWTPRLCPASRQTACDTPLKNVSRNAVFFYYHGRLSDG